MNSVMKIEENVRRITRKREFEEAKKTDGCLRSTCLKRMQWLKEQGTEIPLSECDPTSCCLHPDYVPNSESSTGRSRKYEGRYNAINRRVYPQSPSRQDKEEDSCVDPSPYVCQVENCTDCIHISACTKEESDFDISRVNNPYCPKCGFWAMGSLADGSGSVCLNCGHKVEEEI